MIDDGEHKSAWPPDYFAVDRQFVDMDVPYHGEEYAQVPQGADEKKTGEEVVIGFSAPQQDKGEYDAVQQETY